jgi:hypothetical protein
VYSDVTTGRNNWVFRASARAGIHQHCFQIICVAVPVGGIIIAENASPRTRGRRYRCVSRLNGFAPIRDGLIVLLSFPFHPISVLLLLSSCDACDINRCVTHGHASTEYASNNVQVDAVKFTLGTTEG